MPAKIRVLSDHTINQIAAGEVIENPASVVKELVENSIDAGASVISIEIQGGGRQLIRISDNGCGMHPDDALLCLERHATSKLKNVDDIHTLTTMGFRGEAIPSIASISKFNLLTCPSVVNFDPSKDFGTLVIVDGGKVVSCAKAARTPGTTVEVKSLFFNVPVRKKFLRSPAVDANEIHKKVSSIALGHPTIKFHLKHDGKTLISTKFNPKIGSEQNFKSRVEDILGDEFLEHSLYVKESANGISIDGIISTPSYTRHNRTGQYVYINKRSVISPFISFAVKDGFGTYIDSGRFPVFVLNLHLEGSLVDVNVHPQKTQVRLRQEQMIRDLILKAVRKTLGHEHPSIKHVVYQPSFSSSLAKTSFPLPDFKSEENKEAQGNEPFLRALPWECESQEIESKDSGPHESCLKETESLQQQLNGQRPQSLSTQSWSSSWSSHLRNENPDGPAEESKKYAPATFAFNGAKAAFPQVLTTIKGYILLDSSNPHSFFERYFNLKLGEGLILVNQKNAHARIIYERMLEQSEGEKASEQPLLIPQTIEMPPQESLCLKSLLPVLNRIGIRIEEFGPAMFKVDAIPQLFDTSEIEMFLKTLTHEIIHSSKIDFKSDSDALTLSEALALQEYTKKIAATASRAALSLTRKLHLEEAQILIDQLVSCSNPYTCPAGKPTLSQIHEDMLAKLFK